MIASQHIDFDFLIDLMNLANVLSEQWLHNKVKGVPLPLFCQHGETSEGQNCLMAFQRHDDDTLKSVAERRKEKRSAFFGDPEEGLGICGTFLHILSGSQETTNCFGICISKLGSDKF